MSFLSVNLNNNVQIPAFGQRKNVNNTTSPLAPLQKDTANFSTHLNNDDQQSISRDADFRDSQVADLGNLQSIGGDVDLGNQQSISRDADFRDSQVTDLGNLQNIGGDVDL